MAAMTLTRYESYDTTECCQCATTIVMSEDFMRRRRDDHQAFYCLNGHSQNYREKSEAQKLREELEATKAKLVRETEANARHVRSAAAVRGQITRTKNRIANGVCPCCNRTFVNLGRHMNGKHPDYKKQDIG